MGTAKQEPAGTMHHEIDGPAAPAATASAWFGLLYPERQEQWATLRDGSRVLLRPHRPGDAPLYEAMFAEVDQRDRRLRFFAALKTLPETELRRFHAIDYDHELTLLALAQGDEGRPRLLGIVSGQADAHDRGVEFSVLVSPLAKGLGLGRLLLGRLVRQAWLRGFPSVHADVLRDNAAMLALAVRLGFEIEDHGDDEDVRVHLALR